MSNVRFVGLDVHKSSIVIAVADPDGSAPMVLATIPNDTSKLLKKLNGLANGGCATLKCCYEAGPTGVGLQRDLAVAGIECIVVAPSLVPVQTGNPRKTDHIDAVRLARFLRSGDLQPIFILDPATEAVRDLSRAREDALKALQAARLQLGTFLLRHGRSFEEGKSRWTKAHMDWIRRQEFDHEPQKLVLADYLATVEAATERVKALTRRLGEVVPQWSLAPLVTALQALRGVQLLTAVAIVSEIGDFSRFKTARNLMSFLGLTPRENSSGERRHQGSITKAGNSHVRRVLVESAWNYRFGQRSDAIKKRQAAVSPEVRAIAMKAQTRLHDRYRALISRGKESNKVVVAIARELAGFIWAIGRQQKLVA